MIVIVMVVSGTVLNLLMIIIMIVVTIDNMCRYIVVKNTRNELNTDYTSKKASNSGICRRASIKTSVLQILLRMWEHTIQ